MNPIWSAIVCSRAERVEKNLILMIKDILLGIQEEKTPPSKKLRWYINPNIYKTGELGDIYGRRFPGKHFPDSPFPRVALGKEAGPSRHCEGAL